MTSSISKQKLNTLTREDKIRAIELLEEKKRRLLAIRDRFQPHEGQLMIWKSKAVDKVLLCGNGFGKTTFGAMESQFRANGYNYITGEYYRIPRKITVVLDKPDKVSDKWLPEIKKWWKIEDSQLHKHGKPYYTEIKYANGSSLRFMFHDQEPMSFESIETDDIIYDEPCPRSVYISLLRGQRNHNRDRSTLILATPITGAWIRKEISEPWARGELPTTEVFKLSSRMNEGNLPEGYIDWFGSKLSEKERKIRIDGDFFDLDGTALAHLFKRSTHIVQPFDWDGNWPVVVAVDPHPEKNHVCVAVGCDPKDRLYVLKEMSVKKSAREFARDLVRFCSGMRVVDIVVDNLGSGDTTGGEGFKSFIQVMNEELRESGLRCRATSWSEKQEDAFIARIQDALLMPEVEDNFGEKIPTLRVFAQCVGCISDIENVQWARNRAMEDNKPKLEMGNKDYLSAIKYALATGVFFNKGANKIRRRDIPSTYMPSHRARERVKVGIGQKLWSRRGRIVEDDDF